MIPQCPGAPDGRTASRPSLSRIRWSAPALAALILLPSGCADPSGDGASVRETSAAAPLVPAESAPVVAPPGPAPHTYPYSGPRPPPSPPEDRGEPPDKDHFWSPGYYLWTGREHVWVAGGWHLRREGLGYVSPHWEEWHRRWYFVPGRWQPRS